MMNCKKSFAKILDIREHCCDKRIIVVGDIHGFFDEFMGLLDKCGYRSGDIVVATGDLVDRGPKIRETLLWFRDTPGAYTVEGNHDNKAKRYWLGNPVKIVNGLDCTIKQCADFEPAEWTANLGLLAQIIRLPDINGKPFYIVHAGVDGRTPIEQQKQETCLYVRYLDGTDFFDQQDGMPWWETLDGSYIVASGHIISDNAHPCEHAYCLDGGACNGKQLRAMVINNGKHKIVEIDVNMHIESRTQPDPVADRDKLVEQKFLRYNDLGDLRIYTYTDRCVHEKHWNSTTLQSRGHIYNRITGERVARPFSKFFNMGERQDTMEDSLPWYDGYMSFEKKDGWLGTLYRYDGEYRIATRGAFCSLGAIWATEFLNKHHDLTGLSDDITLVFEIVSDTTKIIINYDTEELVLLAAFNRHTGEEYPWWKVKSIALTYGFPLPQAHPLDFGLGPIQLLTNSLNSADGRKIEGFVIRFENGSRVKIKAADYLRRARLLSNLTPLSIWKTMSHGKISDTYRKTVDPEYLPMINEIANKLEQQYREVRKSVDNDFCLVKNDSVDRKDFASRMHLAKNHNKVMFACLDNKESIIEHYIMSLIRPHQNVIGDI